MSVFEKVLEELRKALDNERLCLNKRSEMLSRMPSSYRSVSGSNTINDFIEVLLDGKVIIESIKIEKRMVGDDKYYLYECSDKTFTPEQCKELYEFLDNYTQTCSFLDRLKNINEE